MIQEEEISEPDISPGERQNNLKETMIGEAQKEIEYTVIDGRQVIKPRVAAQN